ncbi:MAG: undecaprenyl/decaprenyl-phosphate alpha-N-acetylglucosaminyl 1-phosphate transferase [Sulfurimonas sp.]|nr:undecaprenyl/decaprenyl-phosphate alpha-N-acetylglucosaminyl 1-phosphate transferase [Sulfurimonas sp.]MBU3938871.1 undecaprenyl/decaprenyl-phosphate alpha-N-acetylglucosaminyl 1-phosphate transferase [bacterium]MBU4025649.1 undecaprenyl/decaprenyl-phosphate alpha-N-acetylglucosaminyl 1-phosphate transferase [bacterium]MBU4059855.1 undecaprenyl/decaprenyl-phosphate alpha-N-acetylglucosaminyl 1-phosphate transferase [bacterium]MBU4111373.1 undecaprenyl/decaprenyl-phosphate alpha-N-acetylgluco
MIKLVLIAALSYLSIKIIIKYAKKLKLLDIPNERSHHDDITPRGAGIGFVSAFLVGVALFEFSLFTEYWFLFLSILLVLSIGILDDRHDASPKMKFLVIFFAVFIMWIFDTSIDTLGIWFEYDLKLYWFALPFTMFALAGFTNALNLIDGLDGLAAGVSIVILMFFGFIGFENGNHLMVVLSTFTIAALAGFILLNWNPAKVFMGDSGSLSLGFIISVIALLSLQYVHPVVILYLAAVPVLDTLVVMVRRIRRGRSPFSPDKTHLHHIMVKFFEGNVKKTVIFLVMIQAIFSAIGYLIADAIYSEVNTMMPLFALVGFGIIFVVFYMIFTGIKKSQNIIDMINERKADRSKYLKQ